MWSDSVLRMDCKTDWPGVVSGTSEHRGRTGTVGEGSGTWC